MKYAGALCLLASCLVLVAAEVGAQNSIRLREQGTNSDEVELEVGEKIAVEIFADLGSIGASGISVFITVPIDNFHIVDQRLVDEAAGDTTRQANAGTQPFIPGALFEGAGESRNLVNSPDDVVNVSDDLRLLEYVVVFGATGNRSRTGSGVVASFELQAILPTQHSEIRILDSPIHETRITLPEGGERQFRSSPQGMQISVLGLELLDIPDVILLPGEADSVQIGSLNQYVSNVLSNIDSLQWSFSSPVPSDSLEISIDATDENTVTVRPLLEWSGSTRVTWTVVDSIAGERFAGPTPSASEFSDIVVNNPPVFVRDRLGRPLVGGPDGVKRDTVRFREDEHIFLSEAGSPDSRRAYRGVDLDSMVDDADLSDPDAGLNYLVTSIDVDVAEARVRGDDDQVTHDLLVWALPDFSGVDSLQVLVQDAARGQDTLRVIVEVEPVADAPAFILPTSERDFRITRGSTRTYQFGDLVEDPDTPLDSLVLKWVDDPGGHFSADTTRSNGELLVQIKADASFIGQGIVTFEVADSDSLKDTMVLSLESAEALPPVVSPAEFAIKITPGGARDQHSLDDFVEDPDNADNELLWSVPDLLKSEIDVDAARQLNVQAPPDFVGFEAVVLTVSDPMNQSDVLALRIYSSDGRPVVGGIPDVILDRGEQNKDIDLDDYSHDSDNTDQELTWKTLDGFDPDNLQVEIAQLTNLVTYFVPDDAASGIEVVIFQVTEPGGRAWQDTVLVTIRSVGTTEGLFQIAPAIPPLQVEVGPVPIEVVDLDDHLQVLELVSRASITWSIPRPGEIGTIVFKDGTTRVVAFSDSAGIDTVEFVATDSLGSTERATTIIRYFGGQESLPLRAISDITFIAGVASEPLQLNDFIFDREANPDSLIEWRREVLGDHEGFVVLMSEDNSVQALSIDTLTAQVVFIASNTATGVTGRDTINVIALDPALAVRPLKEFPEIVIAAGEVDTTIILNDFLPDGSEANTTNWQVSGQIITSPFIETSAPHRLRLSTLSERTGDDTLSFTVELGGGFSGVGDLFVRVVEPMDESTFSVRVVPNALNVEFLSLFVLSKVELASIPSVVFSYGTTDTTVAVTPIESELENTGVLIWFGSANVPPGTVGEVIVGAHATTQSGNSVVDAASVVIGTVTAGKAVVLSHRGTEVAVPAGAVERDTRILLQTESEAAPEAQDGAPADGPPELTLRTVVNLFPVDLILARDITLRSGSRQHDQADGLYRFESGGWAYVGAATHAVSVGSFGRYAIMRDERAPTIEMVTEPSADRLEMNATVMDGGSGIDPDGITASLDGEPVGGVTFNRGELLWAPPEPVGEGTHHLEITVVDRAANRTVRRFSFSGGGGNTLPTALALGNNYPNPFNPETVIPFTVPESPEPVKVRLAIYNSAGQRIRVLLDGQIVRSGKHEVAWDGRDELGRKAASGIYLYRLEGAAMLTKQMALVK